jgi:hypothetical protein
MTDLKEQDVTKILADLATAQVHLDAAMDAVKDTMAQLVDPDLVDEPLSESDLADTLEIAVDSSGWAAKAVEAAQRSLTGEDDDDDSDSDDSEDESSGD